MYEVHVSDDRPMTVQSSRLNEAGQLILLIQQSFPAVAFPPPPICKVITPQGLGACAYMYPHDNPRASDTVVILVTHDREGKHAVIPYQFYQFLVKHEPNGMNYRKYVDFKAM